MKARMSRRRFLTRASAGAVTVGALSSVPVLSASASAQHSAPEKAGPPVTTSEPLVVYVHNPSAGNVAVMVGTDEVVRHDPELVARILKLMN
jgi:hypothetical protein